METRAKLKGYTLDYESGKPVVSFYVDSLRGVEELFDSNLRLTAVKWRDKRSLRANALLWECIGQLAKAFNPPYSDEEMYERELKEYGVSNHFEILEEALPTLAKIYRIVEVVDDSDQEGFKVVSCWMGSSQYDTKQFSDLVSGVMSDMKEMGLNPPDAEFEALIEEMRGADGRSMEASSRV